MVRRFRIWDAQEAQMYYPPYPQNVFLGTDKESNLIGKVQRQESSGARAVILPKVMQSTGLIDAEGTEVWEHDLLRSHPSAFPRLVEWNSSKGMWWVVPVSESDPGTARPLHGLGQIDAYSVIGNRYEHPVLSQKVQQ